MKNAIALALLACLATVSTVSADTVHVPDTSLTSTVPGIVDLDAPASIHVEVAGRSTDYNAAPGRLNVAVRGVPDGLHTWRVVITHSDDTSQEHAGFVQVLNLDAVVQSHIQAAVDASGEARLAAEEATQVAQQAVSAAAEARAAAQAIEVPEDLARSGDLAPLAAKADVQALHENATAQAETRYEAQAQSISALKQRVQGLDGSVQNLVFVALLALAALAFVVLHALRHAPDPVDRVMLHAVALRLRISEDAPEYEQALRDLSLESEERRLLSRLERHARRPHRRNGRDEAEEAEVIP